MAWFGDTFGEGLTNLKGQITKITKDVLSEDPLAATSFEGRIKVLEEECEKYKNETEKYKRENERLRDGFSFEMSEDQMQSLCELENQLSDLKSENADLNKTIGDLDNEHEKQMQVIIKERDRFKEMLSQSHTASPITYADNENKVAELSAVIQQIQLQNDILTEENKSNSKELQAKLVELEKYKHTINSLEATLKLTSEEQSNVQKEMNLLQNEKLQLQKEQEILSEKFDKQFDELEKRNREVQELNARVKSEEIENVSRRSEILSTEYEELKANKGRLQEEVSQQQHVCAVSSDDYHELEEKLENAEKLLDNQIQVNGQLTYELQCAENKIEALTEEIESIEKQMTDEQKKKSDLLTNDMQEILNEVEDNLKKSKEVNEKLHLKIAELESDKRHLELKLGDCDTDDKLVEAEETISKLRGKVEELEGKCQVLTTETSASNQKTKQLEAVLEEKVEIIRELTASNNTLENEITKTKNELTVSTSKLEQENCKIIQSLECLESEAKALQMKLENLQVIVDDKTLEAEKLTGLNQQLQMEVDELKKEAAKQVGEDVEKQITNLQEERDILHEKMEKLEAVVARDAFVSDTLSLHIQQLNAIVKRMNKDFKSDSNHEATSTNDLQSSEVAQAGSQTDDVKQMTEIIKIIDQGLTTIFKDKDRLERELSVLQKMASNSDIELNNTNKLKQQLEANIQEWAAAVLQRDQLITSLSSSNSVLENEVKRLTNLMEEKVKQLELSTGEVDAVKKIVEELTEKLKSKDVENEDLKKRFEELQALYKSESKRLEILVEKRDEELRHVGGSHLDNESTNEKDPDKPLNDQVSRLLEENADLKQLVQQLRENVLARTIEAPSSGHQPGHRRSLSQAEAPPTNRFADQDKEAQYNALLSEYQTLLEKESNLRRETDRLRAHLVEVEDHYTEEAMTMETQLSQHKAKVAELEDQIRNSNTVYKSANVRSTQHLEALQTQVQLITVQRNDLQVQLSNAEDQAQKQAAALASLQLVLEQFQLDKQREIQQIEDKHNYRIDLERRRQKELQQEIENLQLQLAEAKNGLKAGVRLGEQLERKSHIISELETQLKNSQTELETVKDKLSKINQSNAGKIDKYLMKNLFLGYLTTQGEQKTQALRILTSVLELSMEERQRAGIEGQGGWLASILHPLGGQAATNTGESLSQAFVRFLESESKPQPQLKLLVEPGKEVNVKKAPLVLSDLVLPTVNFTAEPGAGLSQVLNDS